MSANSNTQTQPYNYSGLPHNHNETILSPGLPTNHNETMLDPGLPINHNETFIGR